MGSRSGWPHSGHSVFAGVVYHADTVILSPPFLLADEESLQFL